jgi:hypothetical protein
MWTSQSIKTENISQKDLENILSGKIAALVVTNFYSNIQCTEIIKKIETSKKMYFQKSKLEHIGPFLMSFATRKKDYFEKSKEFQQISQNIFEKIENPSTRIFNMIQKILPSFSICLAEEEEDHFSPFVIRIHRKGKSIPIHKDNVKYEGKEYTISKIDQQLSCVLHLQESEKGGDVIIYKNQWNKKDEKYRNIDFGYMSNVVTKEYCKISNINKGDLVIINPNYYHQVTKILGETPRITLGMFLGIYTKNNKIVAWA